MNDLNEQFGHIYDKYIEKIYRFVYLKVNSQEIAEDITSNVFLRGWEAYKTKSEIRLNSTELQRAKLSGSNPKSETKLEIQNIGAFLYQIARNAVVDYYREKGRTKVVSTEVSPQMAQPGKDLQEKAIINADFAVVKSAIHGLKKDYQDIIIWHYVDDIPVPEIAKTLNKPAGTVRVMLHRGLKELKKIIEES